MLFNDKKPIQKTKAEADGIEAASREFDELMDEVDGDLSSANRDVQEAVKAVKQLVDEDRDNVDKTLNRKAA